MLTLLLNGLAASHCAAAEAPEPVLLLKQPKFEANQV